MDCKPNVAELDELIGHSTAVVNDDCCPKDELNEAFSYEYSLLHGEKMKSESTYVLYVSGNSENSVAVGLSDHTLGIYNLEGVLQSSYYGHDKSITGLRFSPKNPFLFYSSSLDATIKLWDLREKDKNVAEFIGSWKDDEGGTAELAISAFDICNIDRLLVGGTECYVDDTFLLFWDIRAAGSKPLGGYWESHTQDITQVKFHPSKPDLLASGSMDGLINIYDIRQSCEDDALMTSLNTDSTVGRITWLNDTKNNPIDKEIDFLSCITHEETLQFWQTDEVSPMYDFDRDSIAKALKVKTCDDCYIVDVFKDESNEGETLILCGSAKSECLRLLCLKDDVLEPWACLRENRQIVRCCWSNPKDGLFVTGGEGGVISFWKKENIKLERDTIKESHKIRVKRKSHLSVKPY